MYLLEKLINHVTEKKVACQNEKFKNKEKSLYVVQLIFPRTKSMSHICLFKRDTRAQLKSTR